MDLDLSSRIKVLRREHSSKGIDIDDVDADPIAQFANWFGEEFSAGEFLPNAMTLATADRHGRPSARITLLKGFDERGFVFFSNYESRKGRELVENPYAALVFHWPGPGRQVRVEGRVERTSEVESFEYFQTRSPGSRYGAWASPQSRVIPDREVLDAEVERLKAEFPQDDIPLPPHWGGFRLIPDRFEFWQGRENRLHDRIQYRLQEDGSWVRERLAP